MRSDKPQARAFQDWVCGVALPAIRKDGMYVMGEEKVTTGEMTIEEMTLKVMSHLQSKVDRLTAERDTLARTVSDELEHVCVRKFATMIGKYFNQSKSVRMGQLAGAICRSRGIEIRRQTMTIHEGTPQERQTTVGVYPIAVLREVLPAVLGH